MLSAPMSYTLVVLGINAGPVTGAFRYTRPLTVASLPRVEVPATVNDSLTARAEFNATEELPLKLTVQLDVDATFEK